MRVAGSLVADSADVFVLSIEDDHLVSTGVTLDDLLIGQALDAFGTEGIDGCFDAGTIFVTAD
jgi:hypothetical protein